MAYGWYSFDMEELEGQEVAHGRAGIMLHGGGSACGWPGAWAPHQPLHPTLGCVRLHNADLRDRVLPLYRQGTVFVGVFQEANRAPRPPKPPFDRERFVFKILAVVIGTQLLIYSLAGGVCGQRALEGRSIGQICPGTLEQLQGGFDSTLKLLLALLGGAALTRMDR